MGLTALGAEQDPGHREAGAQPMLLLPWPRWRRAAAGACARNGFGSPGTSSLGCAPRCFPRAPWGSITASPTDCSACLRLCAKSEAGGALQCKSCPKEPDRLEERAPEISPNPAKKGPRRPHLGEGDTRKMDPELLNLPLAVKIPVAPGSKPVFCRGKLGEKLHRPLPCFTLDDPYCHHLSPAYNCLHDPVLQDYHKRKDVLHLLKKRGFVTRENKHGPSLPRITNTSCQGKLQPQKPSSVPKSQKLGACRKGRAALNKGQTYSRAKLGQKDASTAADSQRKPDGTDKGLLNAMFEQLTAAEAKKLEELVETVVYRVFERLKIPRNQHGSFLQRVAQGIRERLLGRTRVELLDTSLDHHQKMEVMAKELVATVLEILGDRLASSTSKAAEAGVAAKWEDLPLAGRATQADKSKDTADRVLSKTSLDTLTREVVESVHYTLESSVTSQFEQDTGGEYTEILELPGGNVSNRQVQSSQTCPRQGMEAGQGFPRASEQQSLKAMVKENLERKRSLKSTALANTLEIRTMSNRIADSVLERISQPGPAAALNKNFQGPVANPPTSQGGMESCATEDILPTVDPLPSQAIPPAQARAQHQAKRPKFI
ncbi:fibrous sheath-interacting protein 2 isoform X2 [Zonotrichia leucophrys gambelii]|uniref:fibrous sheath-interacting protein 2 isoform X2 n=1 Tax=Zonotrichia leucophrys gambelii TaxID=257770 RepID=UPI003140A550